MTARQAVEFALAHCSEKLSVIPERELKKIALLHGLGSVTPEMIDREMHDPRHGLVFDVKHGERVVTTEALQRDERDMADVRHAASARSPRSAWPRSSTARWRTARR